MEIKKGQIVVVAIVIAIFTAGLGSAVLNVETYQSYETSFDYLGDAEPYFTGTDADVEIEHNVRENITGYYPATTGTHYEYLTSSPVVSGTITNVEVDSSSTLVTRDTIADGYSGRTYTALLVGTDLWFTGLFGGANVTPDSGVFWQPYFYKIATNVKDMKCSSYNIFYRDPSNNLYGLGTSYAGGGYGYTSDNYCHYEPVLIASNVKSYQNGGGNLAYQDTSNRLYFAHANYEDAAAADGAPALVYTGTVKDYATSPDTQYYVVGTSVYARGDNSYGQFGNRTTTSSASFVSAATIPNYATDFHISTNGQSTFMWWTHSGTFDIQVYATGRNDICQLGLTAGNVSDFTLVRTWVWDDDSVGDIKIAQSQANTIIAANHSGAGVELVFAGRNLYGLSSIPGWVVNANIPEFMTINTFTIRNYNDYHIFNTGFTWMLTLTHADYVCSWFCGCNEYGQLGDGTTTNITSPVTLNDMEVISLNTYSSLVIMDDGRYGLYYAGDDRYGQCGIGYYSIWSDPIKTRIGVKLPTVASVYFGTSVEGNGQYVRDYTGVGGFMISSINFWGDAIIRISTFTSSSSSSWEYPTISTTSFTPSGGLPNYFTYSIDLQTGEVLINFGYGSIPAIPTAGSSDYSGTMTAYTLSSSSSPFPNVGAQSYYTPISTTNDTIITSVSDTVISSPTLTISAGSGTGVYTNTFNIANAYTKIVDSTLFNSQGGITFTEAKSANTYLVSRSSEAGTALTLSLSSSASGGSYTTTVRYSGTSPEGTAISGSFTIAEPEYSGKYGTSAGSEITRATINGVTAVGAHYIRMSDLINQLSVIFPTAPTFALSVSSTQYPIFAFNPVISTEYYVPSANESSIRVYHNLTCASASQVVDVSNNLVSSGYKSVAVSSVWLVFGNNSNARGTLTMAYSSGADMVYIDPREGIAAVSDTQDNGYVTETTTAPYIAIYMDGGSFDAYTGYTKSHYKLEIELEANDQYIVVDVDTPYREGSAQHNNYSITRYAHFIDSAHVMQQATYSANHTEYGPWAPTWMILTPAGIYFELSATQPVVTVEDNVVTSVTGYDHLFSISWNNVPDIRVRGTILGDRTYAPSMNTTIRNPLSDDVTTRAWESNSSQIAYSATTEELVKVAPTASTSTIWRNGYINSNLIMVVEAQPLAQTDYLWFTPILATDVGTVTNNVTKYTPYKFAVYTENDMMYLICRTISPESDTVYTIGNYTHAQLSFTIDRVSGVLNVSVTPITKWHDFQTYTLLINRVSVDLLLSDLVSLTGIIQILWDWSDLSPTGMRHLISGSTIFLPSGGLYETDATFAVSEKFPDVKIFKLIINASAHPGDSMTITLSDGVSVTLIATDKGFIYSDREYAYKDIEIYWVSPNVASETHNSTIYQGGMYINGAYYATGHVYLKAGKFGSIDDLGASSSPTMTMDGTWAFSTLAYSGGNSFQSGTRLAEPGGFNWTPNQMILIFAGVMAMISLILIWKIGYNLADIALLIGSGVLIVWMLSGGL